MPLGRLYRFLITDEHHGPENLGECSTSRVKNLKSTISLLEITEVNGIHDSNILPV